jgi:hypothetical protein
MRHQRRLGEYGLGTEEAQQKMIAAARAAASASFVQYRLKTGASRGSCRATDPMVVSDPGIVPVPDDQLPVELPVHSSPAAAIRRWRVPGS